MSCKAHKKSKLNHKISSYNKSTATLDIRRKLNFSTKTQLDRGKKMPSFRFGKVEYKEDLLFKRWTERRRSSLQASEERKRASGVDVFTRLYNLKKGGPGSGAQGAQNPRISFKKPIFKEKAKFGGRRKSSFLGKFGGSGTKVRRSKMPAGSGGVDSLARKRRMVKKLVSQNSKNSASNAGSTTLNTPSREDRVPKRQGSCGREVVVTEKLIIHKSHQKAKKAENGHLKAVSEYQSPMVVKGDGGDGMEVEEAGDEAGEGSRGPERRAKGKDIRDFFGGARIKLVEDKSRLGEVLVEEASVEAENAENLTKNNKIENDQKIENLEVGAQNEVRKPDREAPMTPEQAPVTLDELKSAQNPPNPKPSQNPKNSQNPEPNVLTINQNAINQPSGDPASTPQVSSVSMISKKHKTIKKFKCYRERDLKLNPSFSSLLVSQEVDNDIETEDEQIMIVTKSMYNDLLNHLY